jgi:hypothetical protein
VAARSLEVEAAEENMDVDDLVEAAIRGMVEW